MATTTKNNKRKMGYFTICEEVDIDIHVSDIIENLGDFKEHELKELRDAITDRIGDEDIQIFGANNLEEEQKIKILQELFYKYSWEELEKIKKSL